MKTPEMLNIAHDLVCISYRLQYCRSNRIQELFDSLTCLYTNDSSLAHIRRSAKTFEGAIKQRTQDFINLEDFNLVLKHIQNIIHGEDQQ